ncbi:MAG: acyl-ACP thioesterase [Bacteroidetes bacterium]|nr:MAG: acyl-ACP thioesterase [Bacteroidota bacterium]PTM12708.1 MAG: acyl-ACP thioesterase [Bacteroidota bacterium]
MQKELDKFPVHLKIPVQWGDMDAANHVNNLIYLRWAESGRIAYFEAMGMDTTFQGGGVGPILGWQDGKYIFPMRYPDVALIGVAVLAIKADRLVMECHIYSEQHQRLAAISKQEIIPFNYAAQRKAPLPEEWLAAIEKLQARKAK